MLSVGNCPFLSMLDLLLGYFNLYQSRNDDDFSDRFNYKITSNVLVSLAVLVSYKQFGGKPVECWTPSAAPPSVEQVIIGLKVAKELNCFPHSLGANH